MSRYLRFPIAAAFALACAMSWTGAAGAQSAAGFRMSSLTEERFDSRAHNGPIVVSFFFVGCVPCIKEIPELHALISAQHPDVALLFVDPLGEDSKEKIEGFANVLGVPAKYFYRDPLARFAKQFFKGEILFPTILGLKDGKELFRTNAFDDDARRRLSAALRP